MTEQPRKAEIKPLAWVGKRADYRPDRMVFHATGLGQEYRLIQNDNRSWGMHGRYLTSEDAMRAIQVEYEAPILAAMADPDSVLPASTLDVTIIEQCAPELYP